MIRAYESHMRNILLGMLTASRDDASFQASLTRNAGWLLIPYVRTLQALEEYQAWSDGAHRHAAVALVSAFNQRIWWEWVIPNPMAHEQRAWLDSAAKEPSMRPCCDPGAGGRRSVPLLRSRVQESPTGHCRRRAP